MSVEPASVDLISEIIAGYYTAGERPSRRTAASRTRLRMPYWRMVSTMATPQIVVLVLHGIVERKSSNGAERLQRSSCSARRDDFYSREEWVSFAAADAAQNRVTPLRRFLWRYGRDLLDFSSSVSNARRVICTLPIPRRHFVGCGLRCLSGSAGSIRRRGPQARPARDRPKLATSHCRHFCGEFLQLVTSEALPETPTSAQVGARTRGTVFAGDRDVARYYAANKEALLPWKDEIQAAIVARADKSSIATEYPNDMVADVLRAREDLVDADTISLVANDVLSRLLRITRPSPCLTS